MARRPLGLVLHLAATGAALRVARRTIAARIAGGASLRLSERLGQPGLRRPEGPLVWICASGAGQAPALVDLARRIEGARPGVSVLITSASEMSEPLPPRTLHQFVPIDAARPVAAFLDHWRPDAAMMAGTVLRPALIDATARAGVPLALIDAAGPPRRRSGWRRWSRLDRAALARFDLVLASDDIAAAQLVEAGARPDVTRPAGGLEEDATPLPCSIRERDALAAVLRARPVWLAAAVPEAEEAAVIAAHRIAQRLAHRLLLILVPADPARGSVLAETLAAEGLSVVQRAVEGEPAAESEILIADGEGEMGLWYRLAPVTFLGGTLTPGAPARSPLEPAALGSAILHGPETGGATATFARFRAAGATRAVSDGAQLGAALSDLLSPDRAAAMAHAAWRVSTGGAEALEQVLGFLGSALAPPAAVPGP